MYGMSDSGTYPTGVYAKGDDVRVAQTASTAVALAFEGFVHQPDEQPAEDKSAEQPQVDPQVESEVAKVQDNDDEPVEVAQADETLPVTTPKPTAPKRGPRA